MGSEGCVGSFRPAPTSHLLLEVTVADKATKVGEGCGRFVGQYWLVTQAVFLTLNLTGYVDWHWLLVMAPTAALAAFLVLCLAAVGLISAVADD